MTRAHFLNLPPRFTGARAVRALEELRPQNGQLNILSLRDLDFIDPFGLVLAAEYLRYLKLGLQQVGLYLPTQTRVLHYLRRSRFLEFAATMADIFPEHKLVQAPEQSEEWLLPLQPLRREEEVPGLVVRLYSSLQELISKGSSLSTAQASQLSSLLAEMCQNVTQHSQDLGLVVAQVYRNQQGGRVIQLAVGDLGIGLRGSLAQRYPVHEWDDTEVIRQALARGVSSVPDEGRGLGLALVYQKSSELGGNLWLRSGGAMLHAHGGRDVYSEHGFFPGIQIAMEYR